MLPSPTPIGNRGLLKGWLVRARRCGFCFQSGLVENKRERSGLAHGGASELVGENLAGGFGAQVFEDGRVFLGPLAPEIEVVVPKLVGVLAVDGWLAFAKTPIVAFEAVAFDVQLVGLLDGATILQAAKKGAESTVSVAAEFVAFAFFGKTGMGEGVGG